MDDNQPIDASSFESGLTVIRRRRRLFFSTVAIYIPAMWAIHSISPTYRTMGTSIGIWVVILVITMFRSAVCVCPRCGNFFHVNGMSLLYLRKCLHCQLHVNADKRPQIP